MNEVERLNERIAHLEDQLETARIQVEHARLESEKADDEAVHWKEKCLKNRAKDDFDSYRAICRWRKRAQDAEAKLAACAASVKE